MGICWATAYILAVVKGQREKVCCIPGIAVCINFSLELWAVADFIRSGNTGVPLIVQSAWFLLDLLIVLTLLRYDKRIRWMIPLVISLVLGYFVVYENNYLLIASFLDNVFMSLAFIVRYYHDRSNWKSKMVGIFKLLGTLFATIVNGIIIQNMVVLVLGLISLIADIIYVVLLYSDPHGKMTFEEI